MTKYIIAPAQTGSDWDGVQFMLIEADPKFINHLKKTIKKAKRIEKEGFNQVSIYADNAEFFTDSSQLPEGSQRGSAFSFDDVEDGDVKLIELEPELVENLSRPEQDIKYGEMKFGMGQITFTGTGKHTDEEFWGYVPYEFIEQILAEERLIHEEV